MVFEDSGLLGCNAVTTQYKIPLSMQLLVVLMVSISELLLRSHLFWAHTTTGPHSYLQLACLPFPTFHHCTTRTRCVTTPTIQCNITHDNNPQHQ